MVTASHDRGDPAVLRSDLAAGPMDSYLGGGDKITIGTLGIARGETVGKSVRITRHDWDQIVRCRMGTVVVAEEEFPELIVELVSGQTVSFVMNDKVLIDDIRRAIQDMGREFVH